MTGLVRFGINNIYTVRLEDGEELLCRIKGKILREGIGDYTPLTAGDIVEVERDSHSRSEGLVLSRAPRSSMIIRWNKKRGAPQTLAANIDLLVCVASPVSPPFRPRFLDRLLVAAEQGGVKAMVLLNKIDQDFSDDVVERLADYEYLGYEVHAGSTVTGAGISDLRKMLSGKTAAFVGQSGVGKSSVINALDPELEQAVGDISKKYNRGKHTTNYSVLFQTGWGRIVDTPGIREIDLCGIDPADLAAHFPEFGPYLGACEFNPCTHLHEPGCAVEAAVEEGEIHADRYESYARIYEQLSELKKETYE